MATLGAEGRGFGIELVGMHMGRQGVHVMNVTQGCSLTAPGCLGCVENKDP